jgi:hypothetical protein
MKQLLNGTTISLSAFHADPVRVFWRKDYGRELFVDTSEENFGDGFAVGGFGELLYVHDACFSAVAGRGPSVGERRLNAVVWTHGREYYGASAVVGIVAEVAVRWARTATEGAARRTRRP